MTWDVLDMDYEDMDEYLRRIAEHAQNETNEMQQAQRRAEAKMRASRRR